MNIVEMHNGLYDIRIRLERELGSELKMLPGAAMFCYLTHRLKFTVSLFNRKKATKYESIKREYVLANEHMVLLSEYPIDDTVIKIFENLTEYVTKEI